MDDIQGWSEKWEETKVRKEKQESGKCLGSVGYRRSPSFASLVNDGPWLTGQAKCTVCYVMMRWRFDAVYTFTKTHTHTHIHRDQGYKKKKGGGGE